MFYLIFCLCQYIFPIIGLIGFFVDNPIMMILAVIFCIFQGLLGYYTNQLKPSSARLCLSFVVGLIISFGLKIEWFKAFTITFVFPNIVILIFTLLLPILMILKGKPKETK